MAIVNRDDHTRRRQVVPVQPRYGFTQRENNEAAFGQKLKAGVEIFPAHVEAGVPVMFVVERYAVVAKYEQPASTPTTSLQQVEGSKPLQPGKRGLLHFP